jgi:hypothetical protein
MSRIRSRAAIAALIAAVTIIPAVAGCGQAAEQVAEQAAEQALGGDVEVNDDSVTVTDDEGNELAIGEDVGIPDAWPTEVPVLEGGTPQLASVEADGSASAVWSVDATPEEAAMAYDAALVSAGYTQESTSTMGGMVVSEYTGNGYTVSFMSANAGEQTTVTVTAEPS